MKASLGRFGSAFAIGVVLGAVGFALAVAAFGVAAGVALAASRWGRGPIRSALGLGATVGLGAFVGGWLASMARDLALPLPNEVHLVPFWHPLLFVGAGAAGALIGVAVRQRPLPTT